MQIVLAHLLAAYVILAAPWLGQRLMVKARERVGNGMADAKLRLYRVLLLEQIVTTVGILGLLAMGVMASALGLAPPRAWAWNGAAFMVIAVVLVWSSLKLRPRAAKIKRKLGDGERLLIPDTARERPWFGAVSVGAGISEELAFRGFLLYYFSLYLPQMNAVEKVFLSALVFGLGHLYQGWKGIAATGVVGGVFAALYIMTGSLLLPMALHAAVDLRGLLIFPPDTPDEEPVAAIA
jgi:membrane protease YdiL (CAAX protease family)